MATYTPVWRFAFVALDDPQYVYANPDLASGLTAKSVAWAFTSGHEANWHPITWLSHALDISVFGMDSGWHHVVNLLLHVVNTLLLFTVLRRMTGSIWRTAFVAAIFAVHPLHVESVAWVAERKDVLSALFFMLTLGAYVRYTDAPSGRRYAAVVSLLAFGLMAKAMLVTVPMVLLLLDYWPLGRLGGRPTTTLPARPRKTVGRLVVEKLPLLALVAASSVVTFIAQRQGGALKGLEAVPLATRLQNALVSYVDYLRAATWPTDLGMFYPFPSSVPWASVAAAGVILAAFTAGALLLARRVPAVLVGWLWFLGMLVPVIGLVQIGDQARADRYMYLPMIGLTIAVAWGAVALAGSAAVRRAVAVAGALLVLAGSVVAHAQVQYWRETVSLWSHAAAVTDDLSHANNFGIYYGLAEYLRANGRSAESIPVYEASIRKSPSYVDARLGLVRALIDTGQTPRAIAALKEIVALKPSLVDCRMSLGLLLMQAKRAPEAIGQFSEAVRLEPAVADRQWRLGLALAETGRLAEALPHLAEAVRLSPADPSIRKDYGLALLGLGRIDDGARELREVLRQDPRNETAQRALAAIGR